MEISNGDLRGLLIALREQLRVRVSEERLTYVRDEHLAQLKALTTLLAARAPVLIPELNGSAVRVESFFDAVASCKIDIFQVERIAEILY